MEWWYLILYKVEKNIFKLINNIKVSEELLMYEGKC